MRRKLVTPEKVTGLVAMSYLVLIPAAGALFYLKLQEIDRDLTTLWNEAELDPKLVSRSPLLARVKQVFNRE